MTYGAGIEETRCLPPFICVYPIGVADVIGHCRLPSTKSQSIIDDFHEDVTKSPQVNSKKGLKTTLATFPAVLSYPAFTIEFLNSWRLEVIDNSIVMTRYQLIKNDLIIEIYQAAGEGKTCLYADTDITKLPEEFRTIKPIKQYQEIRFQSGVLRRNLRNAELDGLKRTAMSNDRNTPAMIYDFCGRLDSPGNLSDGLYFSPRIGNISYTITKSVTQSQLLEMDAIISTIKYLDEQ
jgi:hypothetical protein